MVEQATVLHEGCLPLRDPSSRLPNNRPLAVQRLKSLNQKFSDTTYQQRYCSFVDDLFVKGHASRVPDDELWRDDGMLLYLPHHGVLHPRKKKLRVVLDTSARFAGTSLIYLLFIASVHGFMHETSDFLLYNNLFIYQVLCTLIYRRHSLYSFLLNDCLLSGPDLTNNLIGVLLCFRQEPVAMMADLECMYYQVWVPYSEHDLLHFLWWPNRDPSRDVIECRMHTHIFRATSSPAVASYALHKTALDNATEFSQVPWIQFLSPSMWMIAWRLWQLCQRPCHYGLNLYLSLKREDSVWLVG